MIKKEKRVLI